jgi:hypothetical protein
MRIVRKIFSNERTPPTSMAFPPGLLDLRSFGANELETAAIEEEIIEYEEQSKWCRRKNKWSMFSMLQGSLLNKINAVRWAHQIWWIVVVLFNLPGILAFRQFGESSTSMFAYFAIANLTITILIRNELLLTFLYWSFNYIPFFKFQFHRMLHSVGGLHVGAAVATVVWVFVYMIDIFTKTTLNRSWPEWIMRITVVVIAVGLMLMIITALRPIRERHHNLWEYTHRFVGWFSLFSLVLHVVAKAATAQPGAIFLTPLPYLTLVCLISVFYVWFTVRKAPIISFAGKDVAIIKFPGKPTMRDGTVVRVSTDFLEWHAFSAAMTDHSKPDFGIIISPVGDWTQSLVEKVESGRGPERMWIRGVNPPGFMHMHRISL